MLSEAVIISLDDSMGVATSVETRGERVEMMSKSAVVVIDAEFSPMQLSSELG